MLVQGKQSQMREQCSHAMRGLEVAASTVQAAGLVALQQDDLNYATASEDIPVGVQTAVGVIPLLGWRRLRTKIRTTRRQARTRSCNCSAKQESHARCGYQFRKAQVRSCQERQSLCPSDGWKKQRKTGYIKWYRDSVAAGHQFRPTGACKSESQCHGVNGAAEGPQREVGKEEQLECSGPRRCRRQRCEQPGFKQQRWEERQCKQGYEGVPAWPQSHEKEADEACPPLYQRGRVPSGGKRRYGVQSVGLHAQTELGADLAPRSLCAVRDFTDAPERPAGARL